MDKHVENMDNFKVIHIKKKIMTGLLMGMAAVLLILSVSMGAFAGKTAVAEMGSQQRADVVRFHVRANSNSEEDQNLKLKVRNKVISSLQEELEEVVSPANCGRELNMEERAEMLREYTAANLDKIEGWAEEVIEKEGYDYEAKATFGVTWIPEKTYDGIVFPAGNYEALNIDIGEGAGENWWCVIFPPLCLVGSDETINDEEDTAVLFESDSGSRLILKSKILELLQQD